MRKRILFLISLVVLFAIFLGSCAPVRVVPLNGDTEESETESESATDTESESETETESESATDTESESETETESESETETESESATDTESESESETETEYTPVAIYGFSEYLDHEGFSSGFGATTLGKYKHEGKSLEDICVTYNGDGLGGGTSGGWCDFGGFRRETWEKWNYRINSIHFYANVPLENLDSPYGITFDDGILTALTKIGIEENVIENFVSDENNEGVMTLQSGTDFSLTFTDREKLPESAQMSKYRYVITYTENYCSNDTLPKDIKRYVRLSFVDENSTLGSLALYVESRLESDNDSFSQSLDYRGFDEEIFVNGRDKIANYDLSYEQDGNTVKELYGDWILDESDGTRYYINGELLGAEIIERTNGGYITNSVHIYANSPFYAFSPPADIDSRSPVSQAIRLLGIDVNVIDNFVFRRGKRGGNDPI